MGWKQKEVFQWKSRYAEPHIFAQRQELQTLLLKVVEEGGSDVYFTSGYPVLIKIYGRVYALTERSLQTMEILQLLNWLTDNERAQALIAAGQEAVGSYNAQDPVLKDHRGEKMKYRFRVNAVGGMHRNAQSVQIVLRAIRPTVPTLKEIGLDDEYMKMATPEDGVFYMTGATGSGKSTTFSATVREILEGETPIQGNLFMLDRPIEYTFDTIDSSHSLVHQMEVGKSIGTFQEGVEVAMRHDPSLIVVGESRNAQTVTATLSAAETGHPAYTTLHVADVPTIPSRLLSFYEPSVRESMLFSVINTSRLLMNQRLVPSTDGKLVALRSYLYMTPEIREEVIDKSDPRRITTVMKAMMEKHGKTMERAAAELFEAGRIEESVYNSYKGM